MDGSAFQCLGRIGRPNRKFHIPVQQQDIPQAVVLFQRTQIIAVCQPRGCILCRIQCVIVAQKAHQHAAPQRASCLAVFFLLLQVHQPYAAVQPCQHFTALLHLFFHAFFLGNHPVAQRRILSTSVVQTEYRLLIAQCFPQGLYTHPDNIGDHLFFFRVTTEHTLYNSVLFHVLQRFFDFAVRLASETRHSHFFLLLVVCLCMTDSGAQIHTEGLPRLCFPKIKRIQKRLAEIHAVPCIFSPSGSLCGQKAFRPERAEPFIIGIVQLFALFRRQLQQRRSINVRPCLHIIHRCLVLPVLIHPNQLMEHLFGGLAVTHGTYQPGKLI